MNVDDLIQLVTNRLREFKLSRDYSRMSGDLERMNAADKEVIALEDTLYKLNLLVDTSKSAAVKEAVLAEVITDGSVAVLGEYDITVYATDPLHEQKVMNILSKMGVMDTVEKIDQYIKGKYASSPVTGEMVMSAASAYLVDTRLLMAMMEQDSSFGTAGLAVRTLNPGNVGNDDSGNIRTYESWQAGVTAVAAWLSRHRGSTSSVMPDNSTVTPPVTTTTPPVSTSTTTTTPPVSTTTSTPPISTTTPDLSTTTSTPPISTTTPEIITPTEEVPAPVISTTTTTTTTTPPVIPPAQEASAPSEEVPAPVISTTTTTTTVTPPVVTTTPDSSAPALETPVPSTPATTTTE